MAYPLPNCTLVWDLATLRVVDATTTDRCRFPLAERVGMWQFDNPPRLRLSAIQQGTAPSAR
jgi:hypothetical protein